MMRIIVIVVLILITLDLSAQKVVEQSDKKMPEWLNENNLPQSNDYEYYVGIGENDSLHLAKNIAVNDILTKISRQIKSSYQIQNFSNTKMKNTQRGTDVVSENTFDFVGTVSETGELIVIKGFKEIETFWQRVDNRTGLSYRYYVLVRKPKGKTDANLPNFKRTKGHVVRSLMYSGWGQMHVGNSKKGIAFLSLQSLTIAGLIASQTSYSLSFANANSSSGSTRSFYLDRSNTWSTIRTGFAIGAGVVYLCNLIDIFTTKGNKIYAEKRINISPTGLCIRF